ncbi:hypothetical protein LRH25_28115 [Ideonella azotifigens]|uniref:Toxic anion resistance protein n=1 Tax=Ideonella azotifigens TaxID=513160 RepID=A0ABP3VR82_9BURK|nr:hypothetical protein [Ideonella azotifigens]MCD2344194.1 hypothetical protein [Ideonella azotifigens]
MSNTPSSLPTTLATTSLSPLSPLPGSSNLALVGIPADFPVALSDEQRNAIGAQIASVSLAQTPMLDIAKLGGEAEQSLHRTLGQFLDRIEKAEQPRIFKLVAGLSEAVESEKLDALADKILNAQPSAMERFMGMFNKKTLSKAMSRAYEEVRLAASGKSKKLSDLIKTMEVELQQEQQRLDGEVRNLEQLKNAYRERFVEFAQVAAFLMGFVNKARAELGEAISNGADSGTVATLQDKLQALESRALAIESTLSRLPSDQMVIRQLQNAGISTLQETTTTASSRFASIKMTLLTIHGALVTQGVQRLAEQGAALDANLLAVRSKLMTEVVGKAATAPGDNRLAQARQLQAIVADTRQLVGIVEQARAKNTQSFEQARQIFAQARQDMAQLGAVIRPDLPAQR